MSSPHSNHSGSNYPEDGHTDYPQGKGKKRARSSKPLHNVANRLNAKAEALRKMMLKAGGKYAGKGYAKD